MMEPIKLPIKLPIELIQTICMIGMKIYEQYKLVQANKAQCQRLNDRTQMILTSLKGLEKVPDSAQFIAALQEMHKWIQECCDFITSFSQKKLVKTWFNAGTNKERFQEFNERLGTMIAQLNLGMSAQQIMNRDHDRIDQQADQEDFRLRQEELRQMAQAGFSEVHEVHSEVHEVHSEVHEVHSEVHAILLRLEGGQPTKPVTKPVIDEKQIVKHCDITFEAEIGRGSFGIIHKGFWSGQQVAIKTVAGRMTPRDKQEFIREVQIMSCLHSQNVVQFYGACLEEGRESLIMEFMAQGSLTKVLATKPLSAEEQQRIAVDIATGLNYLHSNGVIHCDFKSGNILLDDRGRAKITDFRLSAVSMASIAGVVDGSRSQAIFWLAPEVFRQQPHTENSDIYGYGVILWEIVTQQTPFHKGPKENHKILSVIVSGKRAQHDVIPDYVSDSYRDLILKCWLINPENRPILPEILKIIAENNPRKVRPEELEELYEKGVAYEGQGDLPNARIFYEQAANLGYPKACTNFATFFRQGLAGVTRDKSRAYQLLLRGAEGGHARAQFNLARMLESGDGIPQDLSEACRWYEKASQQGDGNATQKLHVLIQRLETEPPSAVVSSRGLSPNI